MDTVTVKTCELIGPALDWAVAKCEGRGLGNYEGELLSLRIQQGVRPPPYSTDWGQGGPIIEREFIRVISPTIKGIDWVARIRCGMRGTLHEWLESYGPTPLIAAMRCYVASKLGDTVQIPKELAQRTKEETTQWTP